ncbi:hypothetical protein [Cohnella hashimotonis]|uniref:Uncharacterized protein n=1 Tax=Cohnella hashimotonis TaxID=2826895 RepID=A0ABT6TM41_9BACL|nr:hypothetical protein [Cohnella hashimotonis]MDI4647895.1 hypothetical protein [Cohnella hashimotonis]
MSDLKQKIVYERGTNELLEKSLRAQKLMRGTERRSPYRKGKQEH